ncbi:DNA-binding protein [Lentibacillus sediminis]|uniref:DNA-binding protein n=1 Tax=Lentibacillus sediminis TaxID=1940529 RepID=UPI000C1C1E5E|nr:DNA-binding protein [Lentibacillus sediminis]
MDFTLLALGIAAAGFFIGDGLKNFKNPNAKSFMDNIRENDDHELIKEKEIHHFLGIPKEDAESLIQEYPDIPHLRINNKVYYPKEKLRKWLINYGE